MQWRGAAEGGAGEQRPVPGVTRAAATASPIRCVSVAASAPSASTSSAAQRSTSTERCSTATTWRSSTVTMLQPLAPVSFGWRPCKLPGKTTQGRSHSTRRAWIWPSAQ